MIKVLILIETSDIGGAEKHALNIIGGLKDIPGIETHTIVTDMEGPFTSFFQDASDRYTTLTHLHAPHRQFPHHRPPPCLNVLNYIEDYINIHEIDVVHLFNGLQYIFTIPGDTPLILQLGGDLRRDVYYNRVNLSLLETDLTDRKQITVNHVNARRNTIIYSDKSENRQIYPRMVEMTNYVPIIPITYINRVKKSCIWVGRLSEEKNPLLFIEIAESMPDYQFTMVLASSNELVEFPETPDNVDLRVNLLDDTQLAELYAGSEVLLNTSGTEGEPLTLREARAQGCFTIGGPSLWGKVDHSVKFVSVSAYVDAISGYQMLTDRQRQLFETKNRSRSPMGVCALRIQDLVRKYKELIG